MATMLKMVVSVVVCLAYLCLEADAAPVVDAGEVKAVQDTDQCQALNYTCISSRCANRCQSLDYQSGLCVATTIRCNATNFTHKRCKCFGNATDMEPEVPSETTRAGEGPLSSASSSDSDSSDSDSSNSDSSDSDSSDSSDSESSEAKTSTSNTPEAATLNTSTNSPSAASTDSANRTSA